MLTQLVIEILGTIIIFAMAVTVLGRFAQIDRDYRNFFKVSGKDNEIISQLNEKLLESHQDISQTNSELVKLTKGLVSLLEKIHEMAAERWEMIDREREPGSKDKIKSTDR